MYTHHYLFLGSINGLNLVFLHGIRVSMYVDDLAIFGACLVPVINSAADVFALLLL